MNNNNNRTEFYLFRHGQTDWNIGKIIQGVTDVPLNQEGFNQARQLGDFLKNLNLDIIYSSDLKRAYQTCQTAVECFDKKIQIITSKNLREANFGQAEGKTIQQVKQEYGENFWQQFRDFSGEVNLKFPGGEARFDSIQRIKDFLKTISINDSSQKIGISTHGGLIRNFIYSIKQDSNVSRSVPIPNCVVYKVDYYQDTDIFKTTSPLFFIGEEKDL